jgi:hypothetical protein
MSDTAKFIDEVINRIEYGNNVDFGEIVRIHGGIKRLREHLRSQIEARQEAAGIAAEADLMLERIILEYVPDAPIALRNLKPILVSLEKVASGLEVPRR